MEIKLLELHFSQLAKSWSKSKFNNYSDKKKQAYKDELASLFKELEKEEFSKLNPNQVIERSYIIDFFFKSLEFLDSSTLNLIPFEIVECLSSALHEWMSNDQDYIIVTSLVNDPEGFSFDPSLAINDFQYTTMKEIYGVEFTRRLIQINLPRFLVRDYLSNVVLYHELGHFIDMKFNISESISRRLLHDYRNGKLNPTETKSVEEYFPSIADVIKQQIDSNIISYYVGEYFCDIFASQYIETCSNNFLSYITKGQDQWAFTHPSPISRIKLVNVFLKSEIDCYALNVIKDATLQITGREIDKKYIEIQENELIKLLPLIITNEKQLHYLFILGWRTWLGNWEDIQSANNMQFEIQGQQVYTIVNNLIEKSINSYIVNKNWDRANALTEEANT